MQQDPDIYFRKSSYENPSNELDCHDPLCVIDLKTWVKRGIIIRLIQRTQTNHTKTTCHYVKSLVCTKRQRESYEKKTYGIAVCIDALTKFHRERITYYGFRV